MRRFLSQYTPRNRLFSTGRRLLARPPLVRIDNGTFYRQQPSPDATEEEALINRPLFPGLTFEFAAENNSEYWAVVGPSNAGKTTFLDILRGQCLCFPPNARTYPFLSTEEIAAKDPRLRYPGRAVQYVGFDNKPGGLSGIGTYLSARYESRREVTDFSLQDFLLGNTQLNPGERSHEIDTALLERVAADLRLLDLMKMPVSNLSNGQTRRARIAKALLGKPELLLLDEPFMGLDPPTTVHLSPILGQLAEASNPRILLALRPQDPIPDWITHVMFLPGQGKIDVAYKGTVEEVSRMIMDAATALSETPKEVEYDNNTIPLNFSEFGRRLSPLGPMPDPIRGKAEEIEGIQEAQNKIKEGDRERRTLAKAGVGEAIPSNASLWTRYAYPLHTNAYQKPAQLGEPVIEMDGVAVRYGEKTVLGGWRQEGRDEDGLFWTVRKGDRWGVFGPNGSGKTTLLSMITSDHPQAYSQPLKMFGRHRLPSPGIPGLSVFELQARIGHSSPEVHSFFPRKLTVRQSLESAFAETPLSKPRALTADGDAKIDACLRWFQGELNPSKGWNPTLLNDTTRRTNPERLEYAIPGNKEAYKEKTNAYWYDLEQEETLSLDWADELIFGEMSFSAQRVCLFLRAIIRQPDIVILDEAFGGMDDYVRDKCLLFLDHGEFRHLTPVDYTQGRVFTPGPPIDRLRSAREIRSAVMPGLSDQQALIVVSHVKEEVPESVCDWIYLPEASRVGKDSSPASQCRIGTSMRRKVKSARPLSLRSDDVTWAEIWGMSVVLASKIRKSIKEAEKFGGAAILWNAEAGEEDDATTFKKSEPKGSESRNAAEETAQHTGEEDVVDATTTKKPRSKNSKSRNAADETTQHTGEENNDGVKKTRKPRSDRGKRHPRTATADQTPDST